MPVSTPLVLPRLVGARVVLRPFAVTDVDTVLDASTDPYIVATTTVPAAADLPAALAYVARQHDRLRTGAGWSWAVADHDDVAVGQVGVWLRDLDRGRVSLGYWVAPRARRRGHAVGALRLACEWAEQLDGVHRLELYVEPWNEASCRTAEAAGFEREGLLRSWDETGGERREMLVFGRVVAR